VPMMPTVAGHLCPGVDAEAAEYSTTARGSHEPAPPSVGLASGQAPEEPPELEEVMDPEDDEVAVPKPRLTLRDQCLLLEHLLTHKPYNPVCIICIVAKAKRRQHRRRLIPRYLILKYFGQIVTCDHMDMSGDRNHSHDGHMYSFVCYDLATGFVGAYPSHTKTAVEVYRNLQHFGGPQIPVGPMGQQGQNVIKYVFSDGAGELKAACRLMQIPHDCAESGEPQNRAVAERQIQEVSQGTAINLVQSGVPHTFLARSYAALCRREQHPCRQTWRFPVDS